MTIRTIEQDRKWFEKHGWITGAQLDIDTDGLPDETVFCHECEGEGEVTSEVDLLEVLPELLAVTRLMKK